MKKKTLIILAAALLLVTAAVSAREYCKTVTVYRPGESIEVPGRDAEAYLNDGWYGAPVMNIYSVDGTCSCVYESDAENYLANGWYSEPVTLLYGPDGRGEYIKQSENAEYSENGWSTDPPSREGLSELRGTIVEYLDSRAGEWGVFVKRTDTNEYLSINEKAYSSASLIKLFCMNAVYSEINSGELAETDEIDSDLNLMITESSNDAFNRLTKALGGGSTVAGFEKDDELIKSLGFNNTRHMSELVDGRGQYAIYIASNLTSPMDCGLLLEMIYDKKLVSPEASEAMLNLLLNQTRRYKIPDSLPEGTVTANKTGENSKVEADAAIVYSPACDYIICVIGNGDISAGVETIQKVSRMTYDSLNP